MFTTKSIKIINPNTIKILNTLLKYKKFISSSAPIQEKISHTHNIQAIDALEVINNIQHQNLKRPLGNNYYFITNSEGSIQYVHPGFLSFLKLNSRIIKQNCILDWVHPEDVTATIEYIIELIQEKATNITSEIRFKYKKDVYLSLKWNISYFRNFLYFTILNTPDFSITEPKEIFIASPIKSSLTIQNTEKNFWKNQVATTISEYDKIMYATIRYCTQL